MTDDQDIFASEVPEAPQTTEGVSPEAPQPRDEAGRFATKDQGEAAPAAEGAPPAPAEKPSRDIPLTALLDEREKRQRLEAELAMLRRQVQPQPKMPDPVEDAAGYTQAIQAQIEQLRTSDRLAMSQFLAEEKYGKEIVDEAMAFFDEQPRHVSAQFLTERSPFHAAVEWFRNHKAMQERTAPDYEAKLRAKIEAEIREKIAAEAPPSPRVPPRSLASAPGGGNAAPPVVSRDQLFN